MKKAVILLLIVIISSCKKTTSPTTNSTTNPPPPAVYFKIKQIILDTIIWTKYSGNTISANTWNTSGGPNVFPVICNLDSNYNGSFYYRGTTISNINMSSLPITWTLPTPVSVYTTKKYQISIMNDKGGSMWEYDDFIGNQTFPAIVNITQANYPSVYTVEQVIYPTPTSPKIVCKFRLILQW